MAVMSRLLLVSSIAFLTACGVSAQSAHSPRTATTSPGTAATDADQGVDPIDAELSKRPDEATIEMTNEDGTTTTWWIPRVQVIDPGGSDRRPGHAAAW